MKNETNTQHTPEQQARETVAKSHGYTSWETMCANLKMNRVYEQNISMFDSEVKEILNPPKQAIHTPGPWTIARLNVRSNNKVLIQSRNEGENSYIAEVIRNQEANAQLIARAPSLLKENEQLKAFAQGNLGKAFTASQLENTKLQALNADLLEAIKNVIGDISASYGFDARRVPNESVKKALLIIEKASK